MVGSYRDRLVLVISDCYESKTPQPFAQSPVFSYFGANQPEAISYDSPVFHSVNSEPLFFIQASTRCGALPTSLYPTWDSAFSGQHGLHSFPFLLPSLKGTYFFPFIKIAPLFYLQWKEHTEIKSCANNNSCWWEEVMLKWTLLCPSALKHSWGEVVSFTFPF